MSFTEDYYEDIASLIDHDPIALGQRCRAAEAELASVRAENAKLREPHDRYAEDGEPVLPRGWTPVDGGRLDELEAAEARVAQLEAGVQEIAHWPIHGSTSETARTLIRMARALLASQPLPEENER